jgi:hypothetical protein
VAAWSFRSAAIRPWQRAAKARAEGRFSPLAARSNRSSSGSAWSIRPSAISVDDKSRQCGFPQAGGLGVGDQPPEVVVGPGAARHGTPPKARRRCADPVVAG